MATRLATDPRSVRYTAPHHFTHFSTSGMLFLGILYSLGSPCAPATFLASVASGLPPLRVQLLPSLTSEVSFIYYVPPDVPAFRVSPYYAFI